MSAGAIGLSIIAPIYNEAEILEELAARCERAGEETGRAFEVLLVDDGSDDATRALAAELSAPVRVIHLAANRGQLGATLEGLRAASGEVCVVLDGDLQDPPEFIPALVDALVDRRDVVFATKRRRHDPVWFRIARAVYGGLLRVPGAAPLPPGCGAFCAMRREVAKRVARTNPSAGNLAALVGAHRPSFATLEYDKAARYDDHSRVGGLGLVREAYFSLLLTGALPAWAALAALGLAFMGLALPFVLDHSAESAGHIAFVRGAAWFGALCSLGWAWWLHRLSRRLRGPTVTEPNP